MLPTRCYFKPESQDLHHLSLAGITLKVGIQILPWGVTSAHDFFTFASLSGNGDRPEKRAFIFSPVICKPFEFLGRYLESQNANQSCVIMVSFKIFFPFGGFYSFIV